MCWASRARRKVHGVGGRHAAEPVPPVSKHHDDRSEAGSTGPSAVGGQRRGAPDDRQTAIIPAVDDATTADLRDPIDAVKAALDGAPPQREQALSRRTPGRQPPEEPGGDPPRRVERSAHTDRPAAPNPMDWLRRHPPNWRWIRRGLYIAAVVMVVLPIITFAMAYTITDVPSPGDIRTNQVSTILASDGSELARIIPPEGNRVDIDIEQVPVSVRNAVLAAEDRDFYSNPGFSVSGFARAIKNNLFGATPRAVRRSLSNTSRTRWSA